MMSARMRGLIGTLAAASVLACAPPAASAADNGAPADGSESAQVLVMLRMPPPHFRAGSDYSGTYTDSGSRAARRRVATELARARRLDLLADWAMPLLGVDCYQMRIPDTRSVDAVVADLSREAQVAWAQPLHAYRALGHDDPLFPLQPNAQAWHLAAVHARTTGRDIIIAQVDSGVDVLHPDLLGQVLLSENFVDGENYRTESHGTAVAGVMVARADNGIGMVGVAPESHVMALRACWEDPAGDTRCSTFTLAKAIQFALARGAHIINLSLTGPQDRLLSLLLDAAATRGVVVVGAYDAQAADGGFPAAHPGVIGVQAAGNPAAKALVSAPGTDIPVTLPGARWGFASGASFAAAQVSGLVALLRQLQPGLTLAQARWALAPGGDTVATASPVAALDACRTLARGSGNCICECLAPTLGKSALPP